jgi:cytochrome c-type biogenesis protein CcmH/NrfG
VTLAAALASLVVAAVAAAAVMRPFRRGIAPALERLSDPLEDERVSILRSLRDLDEERAEGAMTEEDYRTLRRDAEVRAVGVLKALGAREGASPAYRELRPAPSGNGGAAAPVGRSRRALPAILVVAAVLAVSVPLLSSALSDRTPGQPISGDEPTRATPLSFFEARVREHPHDVAARLDLASRYEASGDLTDATVQYLAAIRLNPRNAEANAAVAYLLYLSGHPKAGLAHAASALVVDRTYPEGLWVEGLILAEGLHRPAAASAALRAYLSAAPYGSHRGQVVGLLARISRAQK